MMKIEHGPATEKLVEVLNEHAFTDAAQGEEDVEYIYARELLGGSPLWELSVNEFRVSIEATTKRIRDTQEAAFADATDLQQRLIATGDWRLGSGSRAEVLSVEGEDDDQVDRGVVVGWYAWLNIALRPASD